MAPRSRTAVAIATLALLALTGCQPDGPTVEPEPTSSVPPVFASDEEALAAAEEAYGKYLAVSNTISADGGRKPERIDAFLGDELREDAHDTFALYLDRGIRTVGLSTFDSLELQQLEDRGDGTGNIRLYLCLDASGVRIVDSNNDDVTPYRPERLPLEIAFEVGPQSDLTLTESDTWTGDDFCVE